MIGLSYSGKKRFYVYKVKVHMLNFGHHSLSFREILKNELSISLNYLECFCRTMGISE